MQTQDQFDGKSWFFGNGRIAANIHIVEMKKFHEYIQHLVENNGFSDTQKFKKRNTLFRWREKGKEGKKERELM